MPRERDVDFAERMTEHEALMWNIEKDPWLNPSGGALYLLDVPVDPGRFRRQVRHGISKLPACTSGWFRASDESRPRPGFPMPSSTSSTTFANSSSPPQAPSVS